MPNNFTLRSNFSAISISLSSIFSIPFLKQTFLEIFLLNDNDDKILIFDKTSLPSRSNFGLASAKPNFCALLRISKKDFLPINSSANVLPKEGDDVISTINVDLQDVAEQALKNTREKQKADIGCVAVMEVKTGAIKAIANLKRTEQGIFKESYNYMIGEHVEPGSTFKLASILAGLEDGVFKLSDSVDTENGRYDFYDRTMVDSRKGGYGKITIGEAFVVSSNVGQSRIDSKYPGRMTTQNNEVNSNSNRNDANTSISNRDYYARISSENMCDRVASSSASASATASRCASRSSATRASTYSAQ